MSEEKRTVDKLIQDAEFMANIDAVNRDLPKYAERFKIMAELHMIKFKALIDVGFNDDQALELCKLI